MDERTLDRLGAATGLTAVLAVGVTVAFSSLSGELVPALPGLWWAAFAVYAVTFAVDAELVTRRRPRWLTPRLAFLIAAVTGTGQWLLSIELGWTAVLLIVNAAAAVYALSRRGVVAFVAGQTLLMAVGHAIVLGDAFSAIIVTIVYATFQVFAVLLVTSERRQVEARAELAATHAQLRAATTLLAASARDAERLRIARDLHDAVGHQLTALTLELEVATHQDPAATGPRIDRARALAKDLLADVRTTVGDLRIPRGSLAATLREMTTDLPGLEVHLEVADDLDLDEARTLAVLRCVQELVTNTLRHAHARHLWVAVTMRDGTLHLDAQDDGHGAVEVTAGNGLTGMRERIEQLGGQLRIETGHGRGFGVAATVPAS